MTFFETGTGTPAPAEPEFRLRDGAPRSAVALVRRACLRDPEMSSQEIRDELATAGITQISPQTANSVIAEVRAVLRLLKEEGLLHPRFTERSREIQNDLMPVKRRRRRRED